MSLPIDADGDKFTESLRRNDVFVYPDETTAQLSRLTVNTSILRKSNEVIVEAFGVALNEGRMA